VVENQHNKVQKDLETQAKGLISAPESSYLLYHFSALGNSGNENWESITNKLVFPLVYALLEKVKTTKAFKDAV